MAIEGKDYEIIENELEAYRKATKVYDYQRAIAVLNKYHDQRIAEVFWEGLRSKKKEDFPLVVFFATVSALESYEHNPEILEVFMQRWKQDYEDKLLNDLSIHRAIEVVHIVVNEAFQSYRNDVSLNDLLLQFLEKKVITRNNDGVYKTIDAFKFFPKKIGPNVPQRLMEGLADIVSKYFEKQLLGGKSYKEILAYVDFFTDKIGEEKALQIVKKAERKYKSELFVTFPGEFVTDEKDGESCAQTVLPFAYTDEYKTKELNIKNLEEILLQIGGTVSNPLFDIDTRDMEENILTNGLTKVLQCKETFQLSSSNAKEVLEGFPPVIPAFAIVNDNQVKDVLNARYAKNYFGNRDITFTIFGYTISDKSQEWDRVEGVIINIPNGHERFTSKLIESAEQEKLLDSLDSVVSDISLEIKKLHADNKDYIQKSLAEEKEIDDKPFLGFCGEKGRERRKKSIQEARKEYQDAKGKEIINVFKRSCKKKVIDTIDNIDSLYALELIVSNKCIVDKLAEINGPITYSAEIIKETIEKYPLVFEYNKPAI